MENLTTIKIWIMTVFGAVGSYVASFFGGWDNSIKTLLIIMALDYGTGLIVAGVFKKSRKSTNGALNSHIGWMGLCKKGVTLAFVIIAHRLDVELGLNYIRNVVIIGYIANETISLIENAGLMGVSIPPVLAKAIDILKNKSEESEGK